VCDVVVDVCFFCRSILFFSLFSTNSIIKHIGGWFRFRQSLIYNIIQLTVIMSRHFNFHPLNSILLTEGRSAASRPHAFFQKWAHKRENLLLFSSFPISHSHFFYCVYNGFMSTFQTIRHRYF
jgi:hypothetical protein